jgi:26S proteasome regulatory subunit N1
MAPKDNNPITISVESTGGKDDSATKKADMQKSEEDVTNTLSDEDRELKERLDTCVSTLINKDKESSVTVPIRLKALDVIVMELRTATSSMTSVPKPLKLLRPHFGVLKALYKQIQSDTITNDNDMLELRARLADVLAVLAMTLGKPEGSR